MPTNLQPAHTPLPWKVRSHPDLGSFVEARVSGKPYGQEILGDDYFPDLSKAADCAFIVRACNSHEALVAAVTGALAAFAGLAALGEPAVRSQEVDQAVAVMQAALADANSQAQG